MKKLWPALLLAVGLTPSLHAYDTKVLVTGHDLPKELQNVGVEEHLGANLDLDLQFTEESGKLVPLRTFFHSGKPVLMAMVYYTCPSLCNYHLNGLTDAMKKLKWTSGQDFEVVAISMNHKETPDLAAKKKASYLEAYGRHIGDQGWHFLVGSQENVAKLASQLGFKFFWMEDKKQFAHASVAYVVTPEGKISRYLHGIQIEPNTLKLSLLEASNGKIGNVLEHALMFCFQFDPVKNKYTLYAWNIMRIGAFMTVVLLGIFLIPVWWREHMYHPPRT
jgi:protein SCO1/2